MTFAIVILGLILLIVLITYFKVNAFLSFLLVSIITGLALGIPADQVPRSIKKGIGDIMGGLTLIIVLGAMLGKLVAESGAADKIADFTIKLFGEKYLTWGMALTGFVVGIPLFYGVGFVLLVPLIFSIVYKFRLPAVYVGLPMLAALSVTHGFIPPHPSPVALVTLFEANMGLTLIYGLIVAIPAIIVGGPLFSKTLTNLQGENPGMFEKSEAVKAYDSPSVFNSFFTALLPVVLLILTTILPYLTANSSPKVQEFVSFFSSADIVMLIAIIYATWALGLKLKRDMKSIMEIYGQSVKDIAMILLIIAGSGVFKQVMEDSGFSHQLAESMQHLPVHPLILAWLVTALIRGCVGSATVAGLTAAGVLMPLLQASGMNPNLIVLAIGAGSLMFSHVNDAGFWMFKEYFGLSIKDTLKSWSVMEAIVAIVGLIGVLTLQIFI